MKKYLVLDGLFEGLRMLSAATSAIFLLSRGLPLESIAGLKMIQSSVSFALEVPTGIVADRYGRKLSLTIALICGTAAFFTYGYGSNFLTFALAEVFLSLSLCFWSGAFEAYAIAQSGIGGNSTELSRFFHANSAVNSAFTLGASLIGAAFAELGMAYPFLIAAWGFFGLAMVFFGNLFPSDRERARGVPGIERPGWLREMAESIAVTLRAPGVIAGFVKMALIHAIIQPVIYYWQPLFQSWGASPFQLGVLFALFQVAILGSSSAVSRFSNRAWARSTGFESFVWAGYAISLLSMIAFRSSLPVAITAFCAAEALLTLGTSTVRARMNESIPDEIRASAMSVLNVFLKLAGLLVLGAFSVALRFGATTPVLFVTSAGLAGALSFGLLAKTVRFQKKGAPDVALPTS